MFPNLLKHILLLANWFGLVLLGKVITTRKIVEVCALGNLSSFAQILPQTTDPLVVTTLTHAEDKSLKQRELNLVTRPKHEDKEISYLPTPAYKAETKINVLCLEWF